MKKNLIIFFSLFSICFCFLMVGNADANSRTFKVGAFLPYSVAFLQESGELNEMEQLVQEARKTYLHIDEQEVQREDERLLVKTSTVR